MTIDYQEVEDYLSQCGPDTKVYLGCDSRVKFNEQGERLAQYTTAIVVHIDGCRGGKIFYTNETERDLSPTRKKPSVRLMTEVYKVSSLYLDMIDKVDSCIDKEMSIHLDINPNKNYKSYYIVKEAIGYIEGVCQVKPHLKPDAFAASSVADKF